MNARDTRTSRNFSFIVAQHARRLTALAAFGASSVAGTQFGSAAELASERPSARTEVSQVAAWPCYGCSQYHSSSGSYCRSCQSSSSAASPQRAYTAPQDSAAAGSDVAGQVPPGQDNAVPEGPADNMFASGDFGDFGATSSPQSSAPFMIGDSFGGGGQLFFVNDGYLYEAFVDVPGANGGGPMKIADNSSPLPTCRVFFNYNYFNNAVRARVDNNGSSFDREISVDRYIFGWEQCFHDGLFSIELRMPFSETIASDQVFASDAVTANEFGHLLGTFKVLLHRTDTAALSTGLSINAPTSNDFRIFNTPADGGDLLFQVNDESIHLQPFVGYLATPNDQLFFQSFVQLEFDTRGNDVYYRNPFDSGSSFGQFGRVQDQTLLYLDASVGYWIYQDPTNSGLITGIAPMIELHYTTTLQDADVAVAEGGDVQYGNLYNRLDVLNITGGFTFTMGERSYFTVAGTAPTKNFPNKFFDGELAIQYNWVF